MLVFICGKSGRLNLWFMLKWILVYWITYAESDLVLRQRYDADCQCIIEIPHQVLWKSDTVRREFKTKKAAIIFLHKQNYTDYRLDSFKIK